MHIAKLSLINNVNKLYSIIYNSIIQPLRQNDKQYHVIDTCMISILNDIAYLACNNLFDEKSLHNKMS